MQVTDKLRKKLRQLLDEKIVTGELVSDARFSLEEIDDLIIESSNIYEAATEGWVIKAAMLQRELGKFQSINAGQENYTLVNLTTAIKSAKEMVKMYRELSKEYEKSNNPGQFSSFMIKVNSPEVL